MERSVQQPAPRAAGLPSGIEQWDGTHGGDVLSEFLLLLFFFTSLDK